MQEITKVMDAVGSTKTGMKWNSILKNEELDRLGKVNGEPEVQPNNCSRNESVPEIRTTDEDSEPIGTRCSSNIEGSILLASTKALNGVSKMLDIPLWDKPNGAISPLSPLSPIRSPIVADWKAVGSPIAQTDEAQHEENMFETELKASVESASSGSPNRIKFRRQRAMSMVERSMFGSRPFTPFDLSNFYSQSEVGTRAMSRADSENGNGIKLDSPDKLGSTAAQVAQLPQLLREELGVGNAEEATEIFKKSVMDSPKNKENDDYTPVKLPLSSMPSLFGKMPFGPTPMLFGNTFDVAGEERDRAFDVSRRHTSLFGSTDWTNDTKPAEFSVDEYFMGSSGLRSAVGSRKLSSRRHSIAAASSSGIFQDFEEQLGSLCLSGSNQLESSLSPAAASFHFGRSGSLIDFMSSPDTDENGLYFNSSMMSIPMKDVSFQLSTYRGPLYAVEFKAGRTEIFYVLEIDGRPQLNVKVGDLVIVEADRGEDLGKVTLEVSVAKLKRLMTSGNGSIGGLSSSSIPDNDADTGAFTPELAALVHSKEIVPKRIHRLAQPGDLKLLQAKAQEEAIAMVRCQSRIRQKKLPMEVVDAEYQWDRNKLTFYFCADRRIDFRELVRDLFRIYKTRIWMCAVDKASPRMILHNSTNAVGSDFMIGSIGFSPSTIGHFGLASSNIRSSQPSPS